MVFPNIHVDRSFKATKSGPFLFVCLFVNFALKNKPNCVEILNLVSLKTVVSLGYFYSDFRYFVALPSGSETFVHYLCKYNYPLRENYPVGEKNELHA